MDETKGKQLYNIVKGIPEYQQIDALKSYDGFLGMMNDENERKAVFNNLKSKGITETQFLGSTPEAFTQIVFGNNYPKNNTNQNSPMVNVRDATLNVLIRNDNFNGITKTGGPVSTMADKGQSLQQQQTQQGQREMDVLQTRDSSERGWGSLAQVFGSGLLEIGRAALGMVKMGLDAQANGIVETAMDPFSKPNIMAREMVQNSIMPLASQSKNQEVRDTKNAELDQLKKEIYDEAYKEKQKGNSHDWDMLNDKNSDAAKIFTEMPTTASKVRKTALDVLGFGIEEAWHRAMPVDGVDKIRNDKIRKALYRFNEAAYSRSDNIYEDYGLAILNTTLTSAQMMLGPTGGMGKVALSTGEAMQGVKGLKTLGKVVKGVGAVTEGAAELMPKGLIDAEMLPEARITSELKPLRKMEVLLKDSDAMELLKAKGFSDDYIKNIKGVIVDSKGLAEGKVDVKGIQLKESASNSTKWKLRMDQAHAAGVQSMKAVMPLTFQNVGLEMDQRREMGEDPSFMDYTFSLANNNVSNYFEGLGEYLGMRMEPYAEKGIAKLVGHNFGAKVLGYMATDPIGEYIENRVSDVYQQYLPLILSGQTPETIDGLVNKFKQEYIINLGMGGLHGSLNVYQGYVNNRILTNVNKAKTDSEREALTAKRDQEEGYSRQMFNAIDKIIHQDFTPEQKQELEGFIGKTKSAIANVLAESGDKVTQQLMEDHINEQRLLQKKADGNVTEAKSAFFDITKSIRDGLNRNHFKGDSESYNEMDNTLSSLLGAINDGDHVAAQEHAMNLSYQLENGLFGKQRSQTLQSKINMLANKMNEYGIATNGINTEEGQHFLENKGNTEEERKLWMLSRSTAVSEAVRRQALGRLAELQVNRDLSNKDYAQNVEKRNAQLEVDKKDALEKARTLATETQQFLQGIDIKSNFDEKTGFNASTIGEIESITGLPEEAKAKVKALTDLMIKYNSLTDTKITNEDEYLQEKYGNNPVYQKLKGTRNGVRIMDTFNNLPSSATQKIKYTARLLMDEYGLTAEDLKAINSKHYNLFSSEVKRRTTNAQNYNSIKEMPEFNESDNNNRSDQFSTQATDYLKVDNKLEEDGRPSFIAPTDGWYTDLKYVPKHYKMLKEALIKLGLGNRLSETKDGHISIFFGHKDNLKDQALKKVIAPFIVKAENRFQYDFLNRHASDESIDAGEIKDNLGSYFNGTKEMERRREWKDKIASEKDSLLNRLKEAAKYYKSIGDEKMKSYAVALATNFESNMGKDEAANKRDEYNKVLNLLTKAERNYAAETTPVSELLSEDNQAGTNGIMEAEVSRKQTLQGKDTISAELAYDFYNNVLNNSETTTEAKTASTKKEAHGLTSNGIRALLKLIEKGKLKDSNIDEETVSTILRDELASRNKKSGSRIEEMAPPTPQQQELMDAVMVDYKDIYQQFEQGGFMVPEAASATSEPIGRAETIEKPAASAKKDVMDELELLKKAFLGSGVSLDMPSGEAQAGSLRGVVNMLFGQGLGEHPFFIGDILGHKLFKDMTDKFRYSKLLNFAFETQKNIPVIVLTDKDQEEIGWEKKVTGGRYVPADQMPAWIADNHGKYNLSQGVIVLNENAAVNTPERLTAMLFHETMHSLLYDATEKNPKIKERLQAILQELRNGLVGTDLTKDEANAILNEHELLASIFTETGGSIDEVLAKMPTETAKNWIEKFKAWMQEAINSVKEALGLKTDTNSLLDEVAAITDYLLGTVKNEPQTITAEAKAASKYSDDEILKAIHEKMLSGTFDRNTAKRILDNPQFKKVMDSYLSQITARGGKGDTISTFEMLANKRGDITIDGVRVALQDNKGRPLPIEMILENLGKWITQALGGLKADALQRQLNNYKIDQDLRNEMEKNGVSIDSLSNAKGMLAWLDPDITDDVSSMNIVVAEVGRALAKIFSDNSLANLYKYVKKTSLDDFISLFDEARSGLHRDANNILKSIYDAKFQDKGYTFKEWKEKNLTKLYNGAKGKGYKTFINVSYAIDKKDNLTITPKELGEEFYDQGTKKQALKYSSVIEDTYLPTIIKALGLKAGSLKVAWINNFTRYNTAQGLFDTPLIKRMEDVSRLMFEKGFIFLNNFAGFNELPVIKFDPSARASLMEVLQPIYDAYIKAFQNVSGKKITPLTVPGHVATAVMINLMHDMKATSLSVEDVLKNLEQMPTVQGSARTAGIFKVLKRVFFIAEKSYQEVSKRLTDNYGIKENFRESGVNGVSAQGNDMKFRQVTISTDALDGTEKMLVNVDMFGNRLETPVEVNLKELLFNHFGTEITDGASLVLGGTSKYTFNRLMQDLHGDLSVGTYKTWAGSEAGEKPYYLKHAHHEISPSSVLGEFMSKHGITMLTFQSANKIVKGEDLVGLHEIMDKDFNENDPRIREISFKRYYRLLSKGKTKPYVKALKQTIMASELSINNKNLSDAKKLIGGLKKIMDSTGKSAMQDIRSLTDSYSEVLNHLQDIINAPNGLYEGNFSETMKFLKNMKVREFRDNFAKVMVHPYVAKFIEDMFQERLRKIFDVKMESGSSVTIGPDLGLLADTRLRALRSQQEAALKEKNPEMTPEDLDRELSHIIGTNGRLRDNYAYISEDYARMKGVKVGDKILTNLIPSSNVMSLNSVEVAAILGREEMEDGKMILNSEWVQSIIGRDYDIDVMNAIARDRNAFNEESWNKFTDEVAVNQKKAQAKFRGTIQKIVKMMPGPKIEEMKKEANLETLDWEGNNGKKIAFNKIVQRYFMEFLHKSNMEQIKSFNSFDINLFKTGAAYNREIGPVVQRRAVHNMLSTVGFKMDLNVRLAGREINLKIDPNHSDSDITRSIHSVSTDDNVDNPNRENKFYYDTTDTLNFMHDFVGLKEALEYAKSDSMKNELQGKAPSLEAQVMAAVGELNRYLFQGVIQLTRDRDFERGEEYNYGNMTTLIREQQRILNALDDLHNEDPSVREKAKMDLKDILFNKMDNAQKHKQGSAFVRSDDRDTFVRTVIAPILDSYIEALGQNKMELGNHPMIEAIRKIDTMALNSFGTNRKTWLNTEVSIMETMLRETGVLGPEWDVHKLQQAINSYSDKTGAEGDIDKELSKYHNTMHSTVNKEGKTITPLRSDIKNPSVMRAILRTISRFAPSELESDTATTSLSVAKKIVFPMMFREMLYNNAIYLKMTGQLALKSQGHTITLDMHKDSEGAGRIDFLYNPKDAQTGKEAKEPLRFTQEEVTGSKEVDQRLQPYLNEMRYLLFNDTNGLFFSKENRKALYNYFEFDANSSKGLPANISSMQKVKLMKEAAKNLMRNYTDEEKKIVFASLLGDYSNDVAISKLSTLQNYGLQNSKNIGQTESIKFKEKLDGPTLDYDMNKYTLEVAAEAYPQFVREYFQKWADTYQGTVPQEGLEQIAETQAIQRKFLDMPSDVVSTGDNDIVKMKKFLSFYSGKFQRDFFEQNKFSRSRAFMKALSKGEGHEFLKKFIFDITLHQALRQGNIEATGDVMQDIHKLTPAQFTLKYQNVPGMLDNPNFLDRVLFDYNLTKDEKDGIKGDRAKRKLMEIYLNLSSMANSYNMKPSYIGRKLTKYFYNIEMYAIKHEAKVYTLSDNARKLGTLPLLTSQNKYQTYRSKDVMAFDATSPDRYGHRPFGLVTEANYRMTKLVMELHDVDYKLRDTLSQVAKREKYSPDNLNFRSEVWDMAEKNPFNIQVIYDNGNYLYKYNGRADYVMQEGHERDILSAVYPDEAKERSQTRIKEKRQVLAAALALRQLYDVDVPMITSNLYQHLDATLRYLKTKGNLFEAIKVQKVMTEYKKFYQDIVFRRGHYLPHEYMMQQYEFEHVNKNIDAVLTRLTRIRDDADYRKKSKAYEKTYEQIKSMSDEELKAQAEREIKHELTSVIENGFGQTFNPNTVSRVLPDDYEGYTKDSYDPHNNYINNFKKMLFTDLVNAEWSMFSTKAQAIGENPYTIDSVKRWYALSADVRELMTSRRELKEIKQGQRIQFLHETEDMNGNARVNIVWGKVLKNKDDVVELQNRFGIKTYSVNDMFVMEGKNKVRSKVDIYRRAGSLERLEQLSEEWGMQDNLVKKVLSKQLHIGALARGAMGTLKLVLEGLTLANLGFVGQLVSGAINLAGGTILNYADAPIKNYSRMKAGMEAYKGIEKDAIEKVFIKMGLTTPEEMIDNASYGDIDTASIGIEGNRWRTAKNLLGKWATEMRDSNFLTRSEMGTLRREIESKLKRLKTAKTQEEFFKIRKEIYESSQKMLGVKFKKKDLSPEEADSLKKAELRLKKIMTDTKAGVPVDEKELMKLGLWKSTGAVTSFAKDSFMQSYFGMRLFSAPEPYLRRQAFFIGMQQAKEVFGTSDPELLYEYGMANMIHRQKLYGRMNKQFNSNTAMGAIMYKFSHFAYTELVRERKNLNEALHTLFLRTGLNPLKWLSNQIEDVATIYDPKTKTIKESVKVKVAANDTKMYLTALALTSVLSELGNVFSGLSNPLSPIKRFQYQMIKHLLDLAHEGWKKKFEKIDYDEMETIRDLYTTLIPVGYGGTLPLNMAAYLKDRSEGKDNRFPLKPRAYSVLQAMGNIDLSSQSKRDKSWRRFERTVLPGINIASPFFAPAGEIDYRKINPIPFHREISNLAKDINPPKQDNTVQEYDR